MLAKIFVQDLDGLSCEPEESNSNQTVYFLNWTFLLFKENCFAQYVFVQQLHHHCLPTLSFIYCVCVFLGLSVNMCLCQFKLSCLIFSLQICGGFLLQTRIMQIYADAIC